MIHNKEYVQEPHDFELNDELRELRDENGRLVKLINEKEEEIKIIRKRWNTENNFFILDEEMKCIGGNAASKIIFFSKKCKSLTAELESEKSKTKLLQGKLGCLEEKAAVSNKKTHEEKVEEDLRNKLNDAIKNCSNLRSEMENLKRELKVAHKVLSREVGEHVSFESLLSSGSTWRGRQQQIVTLQSKKQEKQLQVVTEERDIFKEKNNAARIRNQVLSLELKNLKDQLKVCKEKNQHDDDLISALLGDQEYLKDENSRLKQKIKSRQSSERLHKVQGDTMSENSNLIVEKLKSEMVLQEQKVEYLEQEISLLKLDRCSSTKSLLTSPPLTHGKKMFASPQRQSSNPHEHQLHEHSQHEHQLHEHSRHEHQLHEHSRHKHQLHEHQLHELKCLYDVANVEKEKLCQLVDVLHRRNEELMQEIIQKDAIISEGKNNNVKLEKQIGKLQVKSTNIGSRISNQKDKNLSQELLALNTKLAIQLENNESLKIALDNVMKAKTDDMRIFQETIEQTKSIFLHGLREYKKGIT
ncbi:coiled-coil domain-containing protein 13 isoform X3 [Hydra vulgaris]|uniref:coiled-coil domain-containing protein 13 isoform X3 n=1 Tax=Hydra vulgaris TaxID=6087 RepID=UPI001F5E678A|nr:coiled-coil domain-containing protein 13 isoform X2 [Hydra vulgaris]